MTKEMTRRKRRKRRKRRRKVERVDHGSLGGERKNN